MPPSYRDTFVRTGKRSLAAGLAATGVLALLRRVSLRRAVVVLTYHRVLPESQLELTWSHGGIVVTRATFAAHMEAVSRSFRVLSLPELIETLEAGRDFEGPACLITFDDGWLDTYTQAWPILREYGLPATVFLPVDHIETGRMFWQEELSALLSLVATRSADDAAFAKRCESVLHAYGLEATQSLPVVNRRERILQLARARKEQAGWPVDAALNALREVVGGSAAHEPQVDRFMSWQQVREMLAGGVTFGGHGAAHRVLTTLDPADAEADIQKCRLVLQERCPDALSAFCYPNGNHDPSIAASVQRHKFRVAFGTHLGFVRRGSPLFSLPRVNVHEDMTDRAPMFEARMLGLV